MAYTCPISSQHLNTLFSNTFKFINKFQVIQELMSKTVKKQVHKESVFTIFGIEMIMRGSLPVH